MFLVTLELDQFSGSRSLPEDSLNLNRVMPAQGSGTMSPGTQGLAPGFSSCGGSLLASVNQLVQLILRRSQKLDAATLLFWHT